MTLKGGRGKVAPYISTHVRVPHVLVSQVEVLKSHYLDFLNQGGNPLLPPDLIGDGDKALDLSQVKTYKLRGKDVVLLEDLEKLGYRITR